MLDLPTLDAISTVPADDLPALVGHLMALVMAAQARLLQRPLPPAEPDDTFLTIAQAAERLQVSPSWLRHRPDLPFLAKIEGHVRVSQRALAAYMAAHLNGGPQAR
jgi:hypothetical protein